MACAARATNAIGLKTSKFWDLSAIDPDFAYVSAVALQQFSHSEGAA